MYWNPLILFLVGDKTYDGSGYHNSGLPGPDGRLSYTLKFTKPGRYSYLCELNAGMRGEVIVRNGLADRRQLTALHVCGFVYLYGGELGKTAS